MKKMFLKCAGLFLLAATCGSPGFAQDTITRTPMLTAPPLFTGNEGFRTWSFGVHAGVMAPFSAFGGRNDFSNWESSLGYGVYIKKQISHALGIQADFLKGTLKANNDKLWAGLPPPGPYKSFETDVHWAASLSGVVTLGNINWSQLHTSIQPYASVGAGAINFSPSLVTNGGTAVNFRNGEKVTDFFVPVGLGIKANLSSGINLDLGYTIGFVDGDNLDGYFKDPILSDKFSYGHVGLEFSLGNPGKPQLARHNPPAQLAQNMREQDDALRASIAAGEARYNQRLAEMNALRDELNRMKTDSDGDGVSDYFDKCPGTPAGVKVDGGGCPLPVPALPVKDTVVQQTTTYVITEEDKQIVSEAIRNLEFDFGKATIRPRSFPYLNRVADLLVKKGFGLKLAGHTDDVGSDAANLKLSRNRAESVKNYLVAQGARSARIDATGYGESQPIATNKTADGRQKNRRVEFVLY
ncbi:MAG: OmpA family protein [Sediminibacterium sp.]|nr:OmpA family protein [Sediminibacterium sp.]